MQKLKEPSNNFQDKCYKTKNEKRGSMITMPAISQDRWERIFGITEEERLKRLKSIKCSKVEQKEVDFPQISAWNNEQTYLATGQRMTKKQLKEYCKRNNKMEV